MSNTNGKAFIGQDLVIEGEVRNGGEVEVSGSVLGSLAADHVVIHPGGRVVGALIANSASINGHLDGRIRVKNLITIGEGGAVHGDVRYGQLSLAPGGDLAAEVRNIPPQLAGDFEIVVRRGRTVRIASADLSAVDPDDPPESLLYQVVNSEGGYVARADVAEQSADNFTLADILAGNVIFVHDGSSPDRGGFDVVLTDGAGNSAGDARRVSVTVIEAA